MPAAPGRVMARIAGRAQVAVLVRMDGAGQVAGAVVCGILPGIYQEDRTPSGKEVGGGDEWHSSSMKRPVQEVP